MSSPNSLWHFFALEIEISLVTVNGAKFQSFGASTLKVCAAILDLAESLNSRLRGGEYIKEIKTNPRFYSYGSVFKKPQSFFA